MQLKGRKILLGISASIAAYKTPALVRLLVKAGADVRVICTPAALDFVTPLSLSTVSKNPVYHTFVSNNQGEWVNHVELGMWADLFLIAPLSANTLAKMATGSCDNLLLATYLSAKCDVMVAPAMDLDMYLHPAVKQNLKTIASFGNRIIEAESGELASGLIGQGRMAEPENIVLEVEKFFSGGILSGFKVLVNAGPTYEAIDPVRYIGNRSSGKMGYAISEAFVAAGAEVTLISGPTALSKPNGLAKFVSIESADEMYDAVIAEAHEAQILVMSAAIADYKPAEFAHQKIKKNEDLLDLKLIKNRDILKQLGAQKTKNQFLCGFALETQDEEFHARRKLASKNLDCIILNSLNDAGAGFGYDTNKVSIITQKEKIDLSLNSKHEIAKQIVSFIAHEVSI